VHLTVTHPLVRQAAGYLDLSHPKYCGLTVQSSEIAPGTYHFALYRWAKHGIKPDESLVAVAESAPVEVALLDLLRTASECIAAAAPDGGTCDALDARHHAKWSEAQANHMAQNRELAEHRVQSLTASHRARCRAVEDQILRATNEKIRVMKESELARANADFNRRIEELRLAANSSDIRAIPVVFGTIAVTGDGAA
jgi:ATP-dependent helicase HepA